MKKMYRSRTDKVIFGVIGGVSHFAEVDSSILRLIYILVTALTGFIPGIIAYFITALVIPKSPPNH